MEQVMHILEKRIFELVKQKKNITATNYQWAADIFNCTPNCSQILRTGEVINDIEDITIVIGKQEFNVLEVIPHSNGQKTIHFNKAVPKKIRDEFLLLLFPE